MLSKNNYHEKLRKMEPRKERFSIRKFSIGAASVLIGFSFMSMAGNQKVQAATEKNPVVVTQNAEQQLNKIQSSAAAVNAQNNKAADAEKVNTTTPSNQNATDSKVTQSPAQDSSKVNATSDSKNTLDTTSEVKQNNKATQPETSTASKEDKNNETAKDAPASQTNNTLDINEVSSNQAKLGSESVTPTNKEIVSENKAKVKANNNTQPKVAMLSLAQESNSAPQVETVADYSAFLNALRNANTGTINLQNDIDFSNANLKHGPNNGLSGTYERLNNTGIARAVTINGNGHELKMGDRYIEFTSANQNTDSNWDIQLKDLTLQTTSGYGPFWFANTPDEAAKNTITFNGVTTTTDSHEIMWYDAGGASTTHVKFEGNNTINSTLNGNTAAIYAYSIEAVNGNTTFNVIDSSPANAGANRSAILISIDAAHAGKVIVDKGATLTINGDNQVNVPEMNSADSYGTMGIRFQNWAKTDLDKAKTSVVQVNGNLNLNMGKGGSTAILGSYVDVQPDGNVTINTQQSGTSTLAGDLALGHRGTHFGVIAGGIETSDDYAGLRIANGGSLKIVRPTDVNSTQPLISYGDAGSSNGKTFTVNVENGGTLDLQDGATDPQTWSFSNTSSTGKISMPWAGLITMWGTSGTDTIKINNPKYINLQRTGNQTGSLMRLEGTTNNVSINGDINNVVTPLAQWDEGEKNNPSYYWYIENEANQNNWGDYANRFVQSGKNPQPAANAGATTFMHSSGSVQMAPNQAGTNSSKFSNGEVAQTLNEAINYQAPYLNQFLNHFSWWAPQRITMGSGLEDVVKPTDAEKYQPEVKTINGNTNQTLKDLTAKDGIKGLLSSDGTETTDLSSIKSVSWYDASTDATDWKSIMGDEAEPTNPAGDLKTTDKSAWAKVTYTDGSVDFANIPLNITEPMANLYTPSYKPVTVEQDQTATVDPSFTTQDDKEATAPTGTTFTTGTDTPDWATINPSTGTVTVKPGTDVTPGAYNVPVTVTYPDKSTDETTVPVIVTKAGQTVTWGDNGAVVTSVDTSKLNAHETTDNSQVLSAAGVVTAQGYKLVDGKLETTATPITVDPSNVSWKTAPNTNVDEATAAGKTITGNEINVDLTGNADAQAILGSKNGVVTTNPFTIDAKGAGANKAVTAPVDIKLGSDLTSEQFGQLVDNNIPTDEITKTEWATKPNEQGQGGVIKITFTDKAANGQPTYLNVNIPASSIKVTTDADENTPKGQDVSTKVGEVPDAEKGIENPGSLPSSTTYTWQNIPDTTKPGKKPAVVVVTYPDGSKDTVPTNVIVNAKPEIKTITTTVGGDPAATEGIANLNNGGTTPVDGYPTSATWTTKPDTSKPGATTGTATVTYPDGTTETVTIPVAVNGQGDVTVIDNGHVFSLHANDVVTHKTSDKNIIGGPVIENFKLSYYQGGQSYSKPYIYTLNADKTAYVLTQTGDNPAGVTVTAPQSINASDIKISWTKADTVLFNNALGAIKGNGQPTSLSSANNGGTKTITYTNWVNNQFGYPKYSAVVNSSSVNWPIYGKGPVSTYPFPSVYIYGAEANGTIPSVYSDTTDLKAALGDASKLVNTSDLTAVHNAKFSSVDWQTLPSLDKANANASATVRINFTDGSYLDVPVSVNVIKVDQGVDDRTDDIYRDITRTINVEGESTPVVQHVIYSRARMTDRSKPAGQQTSYTAWAPAKNSEGQAITNFPQYEVTKPGYTATATGANIETVDGKQYVPASGRITEDSSNEVVNVTYAANEHTLVINYVDGNGTVVGTYSVPGKTDETVNVDVPGNVPTNWKLVPNQQTISSYKFGSDDPQPVDYKVEHATKDITPTDPGVNPADPKYKDMFTTVSRDIYQTKPGETETKIDTQYVDFGRNGVEDLVTGVVTGTGDWKVVEDGKAEFASENAPQIKGYDSYVDGVKSTEVPAASALKDGQPVDGADVHITYVKQDSTPKPYDPGKDGVNDEMNKYVTRTIVVHEPGQDPVSHYQTVHFTNEDKDGNSGYIDPVTGKVIYNTVWHVAGELNQANGTWAEFNAPTVKGYTPSQAKVAAEEVTAETKNATVDITYNPVAPTGQNVTTKVGEVPDADQGIANKGDLPDGTKYSWKTTPDVSTEGEKPAVVIVTYPGGSTVEVPVTVTVTKNPTDADKYTPEGQDVNTKTGVVPDPAEGIKNKSDLPDGTKYTWKDTPDVTTAGDKPATVVVTYPDGSKDEVPVTVHVTNPATDADKYTPEGQDVNTKTGVVPDPAEGIKNKSDLPDGTKYTWKDTPDVTTAGDKPATVVVTYPDGSKDEVPVTIHVTNPTTDADKYTPEGQDVNTKTGVVPDPAEGIKNKGDLPDGTKYTWKDTPDVSTAGDKPATVVVTYPDGSKDEVPVTIHVTNPATPTDADKYTPEGQDVNTKTGVVPDPAEGIKNKSDLPDGTKYTWEKTPDVTKPGESTGVIVVTYPDGSKDEVTVKVIVNTNNVTPETQPIHTTPGVLPNPADAIKNKDEMPAGTKYTWKEVPNVNTVGEHTGVITVTYPDGSSVDLTVKVYVDAVAKENNGNNTAQVITKHVAENNEKKTSATPAQQIKHSEKATLPQTGAKSENTAGILGLAIAAVGSLFGLGAGKKRRDK
ncbi:YPDG domain-containing protein [Lactobacillus johnsonii]|uniref:Rib/alpha-like domain-containing protein n=1 Tax=Lactobacillus johnsonii TaxID=33959 RepID=UPI001C1129D0|nr:Rib/alpha-like domain-containing protein [Lactobacillus johnsonii]MBU5318681.1 YPDG domain-containing protein [Lactobacillus johnsonii]